MKYNALNYLILKLVLFWNFDKGRTVTRNKFLLFLIFVKVIKHLRTILYNKMNIALFQIFFSLVLLY